MVIIRSNPPSMSRRPRTRNKLRGVKHSLARKKWPRSLEGVMTLVKAGVVFPALASLGKEFPVPWIGWIPDFQHKRLPQFFSDEEDRKSVVEGKRVHLG